MVGRPARSTSSGSTTAARSSTFRPGNQRPDRAGGGSLGGRQLDAVESQDFAKVDTEIDWVIKKKLFERYQDRYDMELSDPPKIAQLDLAYHDIKRGRGVFDLLQRKGLAARITTDEDIDAAVNEPPQTTRAKLRGEFISAAQAAGAGLHRRLGAPQAQRPGAAHGAVQGPVPVGRRTREAPHRVDVGGLLRHALSSLGGGSPKSSA